MIIFNLLRQISGSKILYDEDNYLAYFDKIIAQTEGMMLFEESGMKKKQNLVKAQLN